MPFVGMPLWTLPKEAWTAHGVGAKSMSSASSGWGWWGLALQQSCTRQSPDWLQHVRGRPNPNVFSACLISCEVTPARSTLICQKHPLENLCLGRAGFDVNNVFPLTPPVSPPPVSVYLKGCFGSRVIFCFLRCQE